MKRYDISFNGYDSCGAVEHELGEYVLHSEAQARIEALEKLNRYAQHSTLCRKHITRHWGLHAEECDCGLEAARAAAGV